jgi:TRAP-type C4-dicarboxylate transport system permease small subunit
MSAASDDSSASAEQEFFAIPLDWARWWTIIPEIVVFACAGALPIVVGANVMARYTDWFHAFWAEDIAKMLFTWIVFLGGAVAVKYDAHVRMAMFSDRLSGRAAPIWNHLVRASPLIVGVLLLTFGIQVVQISMFREMPSLEISVGYFMTIIPISGALMIVYVVLAFFVKGEKRETQPL